MPDPIPPASATERMPSRFVVCMIAGAVAGVVAGFCMAAFQYGVEYSRSHLSLIAYFDHWHYWHMGDTILSVFVSGPISGFIGGLITALFSRTTRHPIVLASVWASILGTTTLVLNVVLYFGTPPGHARADDIALMIGVSLSAGAIYGGTLGLFAHWLRMGIQRWQRRSQSQNPAT